MRSVTAVSFTYCIQAFAMASFGSQAAVSGLRTHRPNQEVCKAAQDTLT